MWKIGQNPKIGQFWLPSRSGTIRNTKKFTRTQKLPGHWNTTQSKQHHSAVHPLTCSLLWVRCLFDPSKFCVLGANDPQMETFHKFLHFNHDSRVKAKFGENQPLRSCRKVVWQCLQKTPGVWDTSEPPISPLSWPCPKFGERCRPLSCAYVPCEKR